jgi:hypothetical protein
LLTAKQAGLQFEFIPDKYLLLQNYPNPFNAKTKIIFQIPHEKSISDELVRAELLVYDITGRFIANIRNEYFMPGSYESEFDASNYSSGIYFCKLNIYDRHFNSYPIKNQTIRYTQVIKMVLVK